jgi:outer membrane lipoprotein-sorting protein
MEPFKALPYRNSVIILCLLGLLALSSCTEKTAKLERSDNAALLAGTWTMKSRLAADREDPVVQRFMKLRLKEDGTFRADYRGEQDQKWIQAGQGAFSYEPPLLTLHWNSGQVITLLVRNAKPEQLLIHHGRNLAPLKDQEPDEIFVRQKEAKGPTRGPS